MAVSSEGLVEKGETAKTEQMQTILKQLPNIHKRVWMPRG